jgi:hypothetical protein
LVAGGGGVGLGGVGFGLGGLAGLGFVVQTVFQFADGVGQGLDLGRQIRIGRGGGVMVVRLGLSGLPDRGGEQYAKRHAAEQRRFILHEFDPYPQPRPSRSDAGSA